MNNRFTIIASLLFASLLLISACSEDNSSYKTPNTSTTPENNNPISQKNFTILFSPTEVSFYDISNGGFTEQTAEISVRIGDSKNQLITGQRTIYFRTEWGLIDPSCVTKDGTCKVTWRTMSPSDMPSDLKNMIIAYSPGGQETFRDFNGNNRFDDGDTFEDLDEPYIDIDRSDSYTPGDVIIDTINGLDLTGANQKHDNADGFYNGPDCSHSSLCSTVLSSVTVWASGSILLTTNKASLGGTVTGLTGTVVLQTPGVLDLSVSADGSYSFASQLPVGSSYNVTVKSQPSGQTCTVTNGQGTIVADVTNVNVNCI